MSDDRYIREIDAAVLWRLQDVADAAAEVPIEYQPPRLQAALALLVSAQGQGRLMPREA